MKSPDSAMQSRLNLHQTARFGASTVARPTEQSGKRLNDAMLSDRSFTLLSIALFVIAIVLFFASTTRAATPASLELSLADEWWGTAFFLDRSAQPASADPSQTQTTSITPLPPSPNAIAADFTWTPLTGGKWSLNTNWSPNVTGGPDSPGLFVAISTNISGSGNTITLFDTGDAGDATKTVGRLDIGDINNNSSFTIAAGSGSGILNFDNSGSAAALNQLSTSKGDTISAPITLSDSLNISNADASDALTLSGGITAATAGIKTITNQGSGAAGVTLSGVIGDGTGTVAVTQNSSTSALTLGGASANTYTGVTTVTAGTLNLGKTAAGINAFGGDLTINGGNVVYSTTNDNQIPDSAKVTMSSGSFAIGARIETIGQIATPTSGLDISGGSLTIGSGSLTINNSNVMTGGTVTFTAGSGSITTNTEFNFSGGTIDFTSSSNGSSASLNLRGGSGTGITYSATGTSTAQITNSGGGANSLSLNTSGTTVFTINDAPTVATEMIIAPVITGNTALQKTGDGVLQFAGTRANTYNGLTTISAGELDLNKTAGVAAIAGNITIGDGTGTDILKLLASDQIANTSDMTLFGTGSPVFNLNNNSETIDALNSTNTAASVSLGSGTLTVGAGNEVAANFHGVISGTGGFIKTGSTGTQILSGINTYSGDTQILAGDLRFDNGGNSNSSTIRLGATIGTDLAVLSLGGANLAGNNLSSPLEVRSGSSGTKILRQLDNTGTNTYSGAITLNAGLTLESQTGGMLLFQGGSIDVKTNTLTVDTRLYGSGALGTANNVNMQGNVTINEVLGSSLATGGSLVKDGGNTLILQGTSNTYTGTNAAALNPNGTTIKDGVLGIYGDGSLGLAPSTATNNIFFTASALTSPSNTQTLQDTANDVTLAATRNINVASGVTARLDSNGNTFTINGVINGSGNVASIGTGTLIFNGNNTYTGTTTVSAGTLLVNGNQSTATGAVTVNNNGTTLGGTGTIGGSVTVNSGANLAPGASTGILRTGALTLNSGSNFVLEINGTTAGTGYDQVIVAGSVTLNLGNIVVSVGGTINVNDKFFVTLNDGIDAVTGTFAQGATVTSGGYSFLINYLDNGDAGTIGNDISLTVTAVPEPGTWAAASLALIALLVHQRKRLRKLIARRAS